MGAWVEGNRSEDGLKKIKCFYIMIFNVRWNGWENGDDRVLLLFLLSAAECRGGGGETGRGGRQAAAGGSSGRRLWLQQNLQLHQSCLRGLLRPVLNRYTHTHTHRPVSNTQLQVWPYTQPCVSWVENVWPPGTAFTRSPCGVKSLKK